MLKSVLIGLGFPYKFLSDRSVILNDFRRNLVVEFNPCCLDGEVTWENLRVTVIGIPKCPIGPGRFQLVK